MKQHDLKKSSGKMLDLTLQILPYLCLLIKIHWEKNRSVMAGKAGALCKTESLADLCHFTDMLLLKPAFPQSRCLEEVSASALRIFLFYNDATKRETLLPSARAPVPVLSPHR